MSLLVNVLIAFSSMGAPLERGLRCPLVEAIDPWTILIQAVLADQVRKSAVEPIEFSRDFVHGHHSA
jgi:hypothetical protein